MICAFDKEKLTGYFDGELAAAEKAEVERHIASCSECLRELGELKSAALMVKDLPRLRAPSTVAQAVSRATRTAVRADALRRLRRSVLWGAAVAATALVALNVVFFARFRASAPVALPTAAAPAVPLARLAPALDAPPAPARELEAVLRKAEPGEAPELAGHEDRKKLDAAGALADKARSLEQAKRSIPENRGQTPARPAPEPAGPEAPPAVAKGAPAPRPAAAAPPAAPAPLAGAAARPEPPPPPAPPRRDGEAAAPGLEEAQAQRRAPAESAGEPAVTHLTLASTQMAKARLQLDEALKKLGIAPPAAPTAGRAPKNSSREGDPAMALELTETQLARLRREVEKPGLSMVLAGKPDEARTSCAFGGRGGVLGGTKADAMPVPNDPGLKKPTESPRSVSRAEGKDQSEAKEAAAAGTPNVMLEKALEPTRKIILHVIEVPSLPEGVPAGDPVKK